MNKILNATMTGSMCCILLLAFSCKKMTSDKEMTITTSSEEAMNFFQQGRNQWEAWNDEKASNMLDKAIEADPDFAMAYFYRATSGGGANVYRENLNKAISLLDKTSKGEQVFLKIFKFQRDGNGTEMNIFIDSLKSLYPEDKRVYYLLGIFNLNSDLEEANSYLLKSVELDPDFAPAYASLTDNYSFTKEFDKAEKYASRYIELLPQESSPYQRMGTLYRQEGKFDKAREMYEKSLEVDPDANPYIMLGNCCVFTKEYDKSREYFLQAFEKANLANEKLNALLNHSISYAFEGNEEKALESMKKYRNFAMKNHINQTVISSYFNDAFINLIFDDFNEAENNLNTAERLIDSLNLDSVVKENFSRNMKIWHAFSLIQEGMYEEAGKFINSYRKAAEERGMKWEIEAANLFDGMLSVKLEEYQNAVNYLENSMDDYLAWYYLGEAYQGLGNMEKARESYEKVATSNLVNFNLAMVKDKAEAKLSEL